jgi:hypothetical protein
MEFPRECERRFWCTLSKWGGCLLSRNDLNYRIWNVNSSNISNEVWTGFRADEFNVLIAHLELLFTRPVVLVWDKS